MRMQTSSIVMALMLSVATSVAAQTMASSGTTGTVGNVPYVSAASSSSTTFSSSPISVAGSNVGIGTTNPGAPLHVYRADALSNIRIDTDSTSNSTQLNFAIGGTHKWSLYRPGSSNDLRLFDNTNVIDVMTWQLGGNVGIGTTNPSSTLTVANGTMTGANQIFNNFELQLAGDNGTYYGTGTGILLDTVANGGAIHAQVGQVTGYLTDGGTNGSNYAGNLGLGARGENNSAPVERLTIQGSTGNVGIGTTSPAYSLDVSGVARAQSGIIYPDGNKQTTAWTGVLCGGDYAESVDVAGSRTSYEPGDVLVIGTEKGSDVAKSSEPYSTLVTGIYATKPGVVGRRQTTDAKTSKTEVPMAMIGIVPTKVSAENGPIKRGDLLVTSSTPGFAMRGTDHSRMLGAVIGKALGSLDSGIGVIEVVVTLQ